ncbi:MAG: Gfo/Idh/MocA family oxidoreductase [Pseudomonadota bacterium]
MKKIYRVGIAGFGVVGKRRRYFIDAHPNFKTVAVCDRNINSIGPLASSVKAFSTYKELLAEDLDVLFVCMTNDINAEVTIAGLQKGLHVFCEKPPGRDLNDIAKVRQCKNQRPHLQLKYGFNHRYHDSVSDALAIINSKELGEVINLVGVYGKSKIISYGQTDWRSKRAIAGGGILLDQGIHMVDLLRLFAGEFKDIHSIVSNAFWRHDVEDNAYALMKTADGKVAMLHSSATQWRHRFKLDISLEKGAITLSGILSGSKSYGAEKISVAWASANELGDPKEQTTRYNEDNSWQREIEEFAEAILGIAELRHGTIEDAYKTMELVYRIYSADKEWSERWGISAIPTAELSYEV